MLAAPHPSRQRRRASLRSLAVATVLALAMFGGASWSSVPASAAGRGVDADVSDGSVSLRNGTTRVEVVADPLALVVHGPRGEVLRSVDNTLPPPTPWGDLDRPPGGNEPPRPSSLYAPLTFTVGAHQLVQFPATFWSADLVTGGAAGTQFTLEHVTDVVQDG